MFSGRKTDCGLNHPKTKYLMDKGWFHSEQDNIHNNGAWFNKYYRDFVYWTWGHGGYNLDKRYLPIDRAVEAQEIIDRGEWPEGWYTYNDYWDKAVRRLAKYSTNFCDQWNRQTKEI